MDDARVWEFEKSLWTGDRDHYRELVDDACLMVLPTEPYVLGGLRPLKPSPIHLAGRAWR